MFDICDIPTGQELPSKGYIESPGYGTFYRKNIHCSVQLPSGGTADHVTLEVLDLVLQQDTDGRCIDHLSLTELSGPSDIVTLCGTMVTFTSYNFTQVRVEFNTSNIQHLSLRGFLFRYTGELIHWVEYCKVILCNITTLVQYTTFLVTYSA